MLLMAIGDSPVQVKNIYNANSSSCCCDVSALSNFCYSSGPVQIDEKYCKLDVWELGILLFELLHGYI